MEARSVEDVDAFVEALEQTGSFRDVLPTEQRPLDESLFEAIVEGVYEQPPPASEPAPPGAAPAPAAEPVPPQEDAGRE